MEQPLGVLVAEAPDHSGIVTRGVTSVERGEGFDRNPQFAGRELLKIHVLAGVVDVKTDQVAIGVVIQDDSIRELSANAGLLGVTVSPGSPGR